MELTIGRYPAGGYGADGYSAVFGKKAAGTDEENPAAEKAEKRAGLKECETCKNRRYQDGSEEADVSFKAPGHISPQASMATVAAHEREHVANAYQKANRDNGEVQQATVTYQMGVCPECGRSYVEGGETSTVIRYNEDTPYGSALKASDAASGAIGTNIDLAV